MLSQSEIDWYTVVPNFEGKKARRNSKAARAMGLKMTSFCIEGSALNTKLVVRE